MWDPNTLAVLNQKFEAKLKKERAESEKLGEKEFEEAKTGNRVKD